MNGIDRHEWESVYIKYSVLQGIMRFPGGPVVKNPPVNTGDAGSIPGWGRSLEKQMATHSRILDWEFPWTEETSRLQSMGSQKSCP